MQDRPKILVTRPEPDASDTAGRLNALGFETLLAPMLHMVPREIGLPNPEGLSAIALSSANALRALKLLNKLSPYLHLPVLTVGDSTAAHARAEGFTNVRSANGRFEDLVALVSAQHLKTPIFYPTTTNKAGDLAAALAPTGLMVISADVYEMHQATELPKLIIDELRNGTLKTVSFYSRRSAEIFCALACQHLNQDARKNISALCLSENVAAPMISNHFTRIALADYPSEEAMMALALSVARHHIE